MVASEGAALNVVAVGRVKVMLDSVVVHIEVQLARCEVHEETDDAGLVVDVGIEFGPPEASR